jgi:hypothetical protein
MIQWTDVEFASLDSQPLVLSGELAAQLGRSKGAVEVVRCGGHDWHRGGTVSALSRTMLGYLQAQRGRSVCSKCRTPI